MDMRAAITLCETIDDYARNEFACGGCGDLAYVLHRSTGWPIKAEIGSLGDIEHVWAVNDKGQAVDINGVHPSSYARTPYSGKRGRVVDMSPEDAKGKSGYYLSWAEEIVRDNPKHFGI